MQLQPDRTVLKQRADASVLLALVHAALDLAGELLPYTEPLIPFGVAWSGRPEPVSGLTDGCFEQDCMERVLEGIGDRAGCMVMEVVLDGGEDALLLHFGRVRVIAPLDGRSVRPNAWWAERSEEPAS